MLARTWVREKGRYGHGIGLAIRWAILEEEGLEEGKGDDDELTDWMVAPTVQCIHALNHCMVCVFNLYLQTKYLRKIIVMIYTSAYPLVPSTGMALHSQRWALSHQSSSKEMQHGLAHRLI